MKEKFIFCILSLFFLLPLVCAYNYSEGNYSDSFYGTGYYVAPEANTSNETTEETSATTSGSGYALQIYYPDEIFSTHGNNFNLRYNDKIKFVVQGNNHTLTMQNFNSTHARVKIESEPIVTWIEKEILYEFDLNNDSFKDVRVRYDGINNSKAMMFIQEIVYDSGITVDAVGNSSEINSELKSNKSKYLIMVVVLVLIVGIILAFVLYKSHRKRRYYFFGY